MAHSMRGPRSSADLAAAAQAYGSGQASRIGVSGHLRPSSEMLPSGINVSAASPEAQALDAWFNDLSNYEQTLEEMAAASLDPSFKEELGAIESWFRVLSEAERTGALYSLLQTCNSIQVRFFLTVLQQMAKADPVGAILSPANPNQPSMESQMEAKLGGMNLSTPGGQRYGRQSLNTDPAASFLSPNQSTTFADDSPAAARSQRLKGQRISAPGTLGANDMLKSPVWNGNGADLRQNSRSPSPSPSARPKSTGSDLSGSHAATVRSPHTFDAQLSPMPGGSWASMVNTPVVPMFKDADDSSQQQSQPVDQTNSRLQGWGRAVQESAGQQSGAGSIVLDDARKFRRSGRTSNGAPGLGSLPSGQPMGALGAFGNTDPNGLNAPALSASQRRSSGGQASYGGRPPLSPASATLLSAQQAAVAAQSNWRTANGLPAAGYGANNAVANLASMSPQELANLNLAQLIVQQQQMAQQLNAQQALLGLNAAAGVSPMSLLQLQHQAAMLSPSNLAMGSPANQRRSPRQSATRSPQATTGSGQDANEEVDISLLNDIPAWLRALRLHKYTDVLRGSKWQDLVVKDDAGLEALGISALGARRKLLRVFAIVREKMNIETPPGMLAPPSVDGDESTSPNFDDSSSADLSHTSQA